MAQLIKITLQFAIQTCLFLFCKDPVHLFLLPHSIGGKPPLHFISCYYCDFRAGHGLAMFQRLINNIDKIASESEKYLKCSYACFTNSGLPVRFSHLILIWLLFFLRVPRFFTNIIFTPLVDCFSTNYISF